MPATRGIQALLRPPEENRIARFLEPAATMASSMAAEPVSGIAALLTGNPENVQRVQQALTYNPRSREGQEGLKVLSETFQQLIEALGVDEATKYFEQTIVPNLQQKFGDEAGSAMGAMAMGALAVGRPGRVKFDAGFDPRVKEQPRLENLEISVNERDAPEIPSVDLGQYEGRPFITTMSDRTRAGGVLSKVNDVGLDEGVNLQGGQGFMFDNPGQVWASDPKVVSVLQQRADSLRNATGKDPLLLPWQMAPSGGDFATMTTEVMLRHAKNQLSKGNLKKLNAQIKKIIPGWFGTENPASILQLAETSGDNRKRIQQIMDVGYRDKGGMSIGEARLSVTDPSQLVGKRGSLVNVGEITPGDVIKSSGHATYPAGLRGAGLGSIDQQIMATQLLPDMAAMRGIPDVRNPRTTDLRSMELKPYYGILDEALLRGLER